MLVLLPPSETKAAGGDGAPLDFGRLSFGELNPVRRKIADALVELAGDVPASLAALGLSERQDGEVRRNAELYRSPTMPALHRYTGVLYDALDAGSMTRAERQRADGRLVVASALFGLVRAADPIPAYRCSGGSSLPSLGPLSRLWRPVLEPVLAGVGELVVDLRSGSYAALARVPGAITVRALSEDAHGRRTTISHFNKAHKGGFARLLATTRRDPKNARALVAIGERAGLRVEHPDEHTIDLIV